MQQIPANKAEKQCPHREEDGQGAKPNGTCTSHTMKFLVAACNTEERCTTLALMRPYQGGPQCR